ncbi:hypothetical protein [Methylobacterium oryzae]|uniref:Protein of unassigned function n=1 Tax=Methylobacterium oryzae CBMB20 TaxID=693986 RepID=A0A089P362_9HYPH|nr:hypothetical protein [Methylobacterium oryzae]AIQ92453.1 protein of unassigned function [Methylobacterium oryzae CBMB20]
MAPDTHDPDRIIGDIFCRLSRCRESLGEDSLVKVAAAVRVALGAAVLEEAERRAAALAERTGPRPRDVRVTAWARRTGGDPYDVGDDLP